ncbi:MAG: transporter substrate-binding domain-containing protein [Bacillota bacterium]|nr:transporter substrate-binding domain-containing protein [Bacillota bacterium]
MKKTLKTILLMLLTCSMVLGLCCACGNEEETYYSSADELATKRISIWQGFTYEGFIKEHYPSAEYYYFGDINLMYEALQSNKVDAFAYEECFQSFAKKDGLNISKLEDLKYPTKYGFIYSDKEKSKTLLNQMNEYLAKVKKSGELAVLQEEWLFSGETKEAPEINTWDTSAGEVIVSTPASQVPFHYLYNGEFSGYEAALLTKFCEEYKYKLTINIAQWDAMLADVQTGRSDIGVGCIEMSDYHQEAFAMCDSTFDGNFVLYVKANPANEPMYTKEELEGKVAAGLTGSIDDFVVENTFKDYVIDHYQTTNDALYALSIGKADYAISGIGVINEVIKKMEGITYLKEPAYNQHLCAIFNKEDAKSQKLLKEFNEYLAQAKESGELNQINSKWNTYLSEGELMERSFSGEEINIAIYPFEVPYSFMKENEYYGIEIDIANAFCEKYGYTPNFVSMDFSALLPALMSNKCSIGIANVAYTEERAKSVDFSEPYIDVPLHFVVRTKGTTSKSLTEKLKTSFYRTFIEENRYEMFISGIITTLAITISSAILGTVLGFAIYMLCRKGNKLLNVFFDIFSRLMIGLPMVVILMILYYIIFGHSDLSGTIIATVGFTISVMLAVYSDLKVSVKAFDKGQIEGAYAIGLTDVQTFFRIILPQALQTFLPAYKGNIIGLINGTAVVGFIAVQDLTKMSDLIRARTYEAFFPLLATAIIYLILGALLTSIVKKVQFNFEPERRSKEKILKKFNK